MRTRRRRTRRCRCGQPKHILCTLFAWLLQSLSVQRPGKMSLQLCNSALHRQRLGSYFPDAGQPCCLLAEGRALAQVNCSGPLQRKPLQEANQNLAALVPAEAPAAAAKPATRQAPARAAAGARPAPPPPPPPLPPRGALARAAKGLAATGGPAPVEAERSGPSGTSAGPPARPPPQAGAFVPSVESLQELRAGAPRRCASRARERLLAP